MFKEKLERDDRQMRLMHDMMERLAVNVEEAARERFGGALVSAIHACRACARGDACSQWLHDVRTEGERPAFCPNVEFFLAHGDAKRLGCQKNRLDA